MTHQNLSKSESKKLRWFYRLTLSSGDFKHAYRCSEYMLDENERHDRDGGDDLLLRALYCSMVVSYARPFNSGGRSRIGRIPPLSNELDAIYSVEESELHRYVLQCRNKLLAHSDAESLNPDLFVASDLPKGMIVPLINDGMAPFVTEYTKKFRQMAEKAYNWTAEERYRHENEIRHFLPVKKWGETFMGDEGGI